MSSQATLSDIAVIQRGVTPANSGEPLVSHGLVGIVKPASDADDLEVGDGLDAEVRGRPPVRLKAGDVLLTVRPSEVEVSVIDDSFLVGFLAARGSYVIRLRPGLQPVSPHFVAAWIQSPNFGRQLEAATTGMTVPRLSPAALRSFTIPVLSPARQAEIADLSRTFSAAATALSRSLTALNELWAVELEFAMLDESDA